jgi:hypothetical protein
LSRPIKKGVEYFPHVCTHGRTIYILEQRWGNDGYAFWFKLLELLGSTEGHVLDIRNATTREFLAAKTHLSAEQCYEILNLLADLEAIDQELWREHNVIWCQNFVDHLEPVYRKRHTETPTKPSFRDENISIAEVSVAESTQRKEKKSKVKKSREKEREGKNLPPLPPPNDYEKLILEVLSQVENYPFDQDVDLRLIRDIAADYPDIDLIQEIKHWATWVLDKPLIDGKSKPRSQIRNWIRKAREFKHIDNRWRNVKDRRNQSFEDYMREAMAYAPK